LHELIPSPRRAPEPRRTRDTLARHNALAGVAANAAARTTTYAAAAAAAAAAA